MLHNTLFICPIVSTNISSSLCFSSCTIDTTSSRDGVMQQTLLQRNCIRRWFYCSWFICYIFQLLSNSIKIPLHSKKSTPENKKCCLSKHQSEFKIGRHHCIKSISVFGVILVRIILVRIGVPLRIQTKFGKTGTRITSNTATFHAVHATSCSCTWKLSL